MKKLIAITLILTLLLPTAALADLPDISGLSYDELVALRDKIDIAIMESEEHLEIELPPGLWSVGVDFPAGCWLVTPADNQYLNLWYGDVLNESKTGAGWGWDSVNGYNNTMSTKKNRDGSWKDPDYPHFVTIRMQDGWYLKNAGTVILTPGAEE